MTYSALYLGYALQQEAQHRQESWIKVLSNKHVYENTYQKDVHGLGAIPARLVCMPHLLLPKNLSRYLASWSATCSLSFII